jgi:HSP20 family molecular chaperone IbpA
MSTQLLEKQEKKTTKQRKLYNAPIALFDTGETFILLVELPGVDQNTLQVKVEKGSLIIEGALQLDLPSEATRTYSEITLGDYRRVVDLADQVDEERIEANFKSGLLKLTLPKSKGAAPRKIAVKVV